MPESLLADGLGLDTGTYDDDDPLLFGSIDLDDGIAVDPAADGEPAGAVEDAIELVPVRFADGTPYRDEPVSELSMDSEPVAEAADASEFDADDAALDAAREIHDRSATDLLDRAGADEDDFEHRIPVVI